MAGSTELSLHLAEAAPAPERRPRVLLVGTAFACAAAAVTFLTMITAYLSIRADVLAQGDTWLPDGAFIPLSPGNMSMITLVMSLVTMQWAVWAGANKDRGHAYLALGITLIFGVAHLTEMGYLMTEWNVPLNGTATTAGTLLFSIVGGHMAMTIAGMIFIGLMGVRSLGGQFTGRDAEGLAAAAMYWWTTVGVFSIVWLAVMIGK